MKRSLMILLSLLGFNASLLAQGVTRTANSPRAGDVICKQELKYKSPGRDGKGVVWDFSDLPTIGRKKTEAYMAAEDSSIVLYGENSLHYYRTCGDSILCIGYEIPTMQMKYIVSKYDMRYPFAYGDSISSYHYGEGIFSKTMSLVRYGRSEVKADAVGTLILPEGDTLHHVTRVKENVHFGQRTSPFANILCLGNETVYSPDSISERLHTDSITWKIERYLWYALGYRYPVFETIRTFIVSNGHATQHFDKSYYFPPADQLALTDDENEEIREHLNQGMHHAEHDYADGSINNDYNYNCFLDEGGNSLSVELLLKRSSNVELLVSNIQGMVIYTSDKQQKGSGLHRFNIDLSSAHVGIYLFSVIVDGKVKTQKIVKQ